MQNTFVGVNYLTNPNRVEALNNMSVFDQAKDDKMIFVSRCSINWTRDVFLVGKRKYSLKRIKKHTNTNGVSTNQFKKE